MLNKKLFALPVAALAVIVPLSQVDAATEALQKQRGNHEELGITVDKQETEAGLILTITSTTEEGVEKIQSENRREERFGDALISKELIDNGAILTIDQDKLEEIKPERGMKHRGFENVEIEREESDNQLIMTITTDDAETLEKIQSSDKHSQKFGEALISQENIENGTILTIDKTQLEDKIQHIKSRLKQ